MIEHVRRRALLSKEFDEVIVCTCDLRIKKVINDNSGKVILTSRKHKNGTSRVIEALKKIKASHIVIIQGDEPLIDPKYFKIFIKNIKKDNLKKNIHAWNLVSQIKKNIMYKFINFLNPSLKVKNNNGNKNNIPISLPKNLWAHSHQKITLNSSKVIE